MLAGHKNAVLEVHWLPDGQSLASASADKTVALWDANKGKRTKKLAGHTGVVNSVHVARRGDPLIVSGSDDGTVRLWDARERRSLVELDSEYAVTAVSFADDEQLVFSGGIDNVIKAWDLRMNELVYTLEGHGDTITGLSVSPDGSFLLSNAMDSTLRSWDVRPFVEGAREQKRFFGLQHNVQKTLLKCAWSPDGTKVSAGSSDQIVRGPLPDATRHRLTLRARARSLPRSTRCTSLMSTLKRSSTICPGTRALSTRSSFTRRSPSLARVVRTATFSWARSRRDVGFQRRGAFPTSHV